MMNDPGGIPPDRRYRLTFALSALLCWGCGSGGEPAPSTINSPGVDGGPSGAPTAAPSVPIPAGMSIAKFCNTLERASGMPLEFVLEVGQPPVSFRAVSGTCTPARGEPCLAIPTGDVTISLLLDGEPLGMAITAAIPAGQEIVFETQLMNQQLTLGRTLVLPGACELIDLTPVPDGGA
jgi:hypothetical protein